MVYWLLANIIVLIGFIFFLMRHNKRIIRQQIKNAYIKELSTNIELAIKYINASLELIDKKSKTCYRLLLQAESKIKSIQPKYSAEKIIKKQPPDLIDLTTDDKEVSNIPQSNTNASTLQPSRKSEITMKTFFVQLWEILQPKKKQSSSIKNLSTSNLSNLQDHKNNIDKKTTNLDIKNYQHIMEDLLAQQLHKCADNPSELQTWIHLAQKKGYSLTQIAKFAQVDLAQIQLITNLPKLIHGQPKKEKPEHSSISQ